MSTPQEENVDRENGRKLRIFIGFLVIKFYCFPSSSFLSSSSDFFSPRNSIKDCHLPLLVPLVLMSRVVNNNRGFLQLLADCPVHQRKFLLKTATPQQIHALVQVLHNILMGHISIPEENKRILLS